MASMSFVAARELAAPPADLFLGSLIDALGQKTCTRADPYISRPEMGVICAVPTSFQSLDVIDTVSAWLHRTACA